MVGMMMAVMAGGAKKTAAAPVVHLDASRASSQFGDTSRLTHVSTDGSAVKCLVNGGSIPSLAISPNSGTMVYRKANQNGCDALVCASSAAVWLNLNRSIKVSEVFADGTTGGTLLLVCKPGWGGCPWYTTIGLGDEYVSFQDATAYFNFGMGVGSGARVTFGYPSTQGWGMMYFVSDPQAQQTRWRVRQGGVWKNTEQIAPFSAAYFTAASIVGWTGNLTNTWSGTLGELRVYKYALSSTDLDVLVQSLLTKWGI